MPACHAGNAAVQAICRSPTTYVKTSGLRDGEQVTLAQGQREHQVRVGLDESTFDGRTRAAAAECLGGERGAEPMCIVEQ